MKLGKVPAGGCELVPGLVVQALPQAGGSLVLAAKPLKASGAGPPESMLAVAQLSPQNSTAPDAVWFPSTKAPCAGNANKIVEALFDDDR